MLRSCRGFAGRPAGVASLTCERESNTSAGPRRHVGSSDVAPRPFGHTNHRLFRNGQKSTSCGLQSRDPMDGVKTSPPCSGLSRAAKAQALIPASGIIPSNSMHHLGPVWAASGTGFRDCPQAFVLLPPPIRGRARHSSWGAAGPECRHATAPTERSRPVLKHGKCTALAKPHFRGALALVT